MVQSISQESVYLNNASEGAAPMIFALTGFRSSQYFPGDISLISPVIFHEIRI